MVNLLKYFQENFATETKFNLKQKTLLNYIQQNDQ